MSDEDDPIDLDKVREADELLDEAEEIREEAGREKRQILDDELEDEYMGKKRVFTVAEAAEVTGYSEETIRRYCRKGELQAGGGGEHGKQFRIPRHELERWWREDMGGGELFPDDDSDDDGQN